MKKKAKKPEGRGQRAEGRKRPGRPRGDNLARSIKDAAAQLSLPYSVLVMARAKGCRAFRPDGRVHKDTLVQFIAEHPELLADADVLMDKFKWDAREKQARAEMREHRLAVARREFIPAREMRLEFTRAVVDMKKRLLEGMRTNAQEICLHLAATEEQFAWAIQKAERRSREILTEFAKGEWATK